MFSPNALSILIVIFTVSLICQYVEGFSNVCLSRVSTSAQRPSSLVELRAASTSRNKVGSSTRTASAPAIQVKSRDDWKELMDDKEEDEQLTLIFFTAKFCKTCHAVGRDWKAKVVPLATNVNQDSSSPKQLRLASADFVDNRENKLFQDLNMRNLPAVQFYHKGQLLSGFSCAPKEFHRVVETLDDYLDADSIEDFKSTLPILRP